MSAPRRGWVLYDDACGFCRRWVPGWALTLRRHGFDVAPLQAGWVAERLRAAGGDPLADIGLLQPDGGLLRGAAVYRHVLRRIWWAWPLWLLSVAPGLRTVFDRTYRAFADNRHRISAACGLPGEPARRGDAGPPRG